MHPVGHEAERPRRMPLRPPAPAVPAADPSIAEQLGEDIPDDPCCQGRSVAVRQEGRIPPLRLRASQALDGMVAQHMGEPLPDRNQARLVEL